MQKLMFKMTANYELKLMRKEVGVDYLRVLHQQMPGASKENHSQDSHSPVKT